MTASSAACRTSSATGRQVENGPTQSIPVDPGTPSPSPSSDQYPDLTSTTDANKSDQSPTPNPVPIVAGTSEIAFKSSELDLQGYLCVPEGVGPFPAVIYNHGGLGDQIGGPPKETCERLAQAGFVGFSPIRRPTRSMNGHIDDVFAGLAYVINLGYVDPNRLAMLGFSRGGLLTFQAATLMPDLRAIVLMAPAPGGQNDLENIIEDVDAVTAPVLILIAENDTEPNDLVALSNMVKDALDDAGKQATLIMYPPFGEDGHFMFFTIGEYWDDVLHFLAANLTETPGTR